MRGWRKAKSAGDGKAVVAHGSAAVVVVVVVPGEERPGLLGMLKEAERLPSLWQVGAVKWLESGRWCWASRSCQRCCLSGSAAVGGR